MNKTIITSNRLPLQVNIKDQKLKITSSVGGLATGMKSVHAEGDAIWIGWSGIPNEELDPSMSLQVDEAIRKQKCISVPLSAEDVEQYYEGFSNKALWPLFHYFMEYSRFEQEEWEAYKRVNQKFADVILDHIEDGDTVWIHDYQLLLLPELIKNSKPNTSIGFFLHIPFPSYEIFRTFPWCKQLLKGMLGADLIGFHTYDYERHFLSSVKRILRLDVNFNQISYQDRLVKVDSFPMGIDYEKFHQAALHQSMNVNKKSDLLERLKAHQSKDRKLILSIDRMDYTKGIPNRIKAFEYFLEKYPKYKEKVRLVMLAVPSRSNVPQYQKLKRETDELVGRINGKFASVSWTPIWYFYRALPFKDLIDLYISSEVALITPIRDGMNLVAKEYVATRIQKDGVLILSEMAGAAKEMNEAILINPNSFEDFADSLEMALSMPKEEQTKRMSHLQKRLKRYNVEKWAQEFFKALENTKYQEGANMAKKFTDQIEKQFIKDFKSKKEKLLILDYDGTLVGFENNPLDAKPSNDLYDLLDQLQGEKNTTVAIISGRDKDTFDSWFGNKNYNLISDHGVWWFSDKKWTALERVKIDWMENIMPILETFVDRTPGTFIETKKYSLAWHYRMADPELAKIRTIELNTVLTSMVANNELSILQGNKVIEIKSSNVNKGRAMNQILLQKKYDFIAIAGDDWTDEYMFDEAPERAYTLKVGLENTKAKYHIKSHERILELLSKLISK
ncbi:MAG: bifunctional alpha,alpha-trehalose-phosphate synthase (UDP-forming)/trehalose-phosphatase [Flavobacteriaceae bacterium]